MIKFQKYTPDVYYKNSRDFQTLGRICDVLFNYCLMNIDIMLGSPVSDNTDLSLLDLALLTLGFYKPHTYTNVDLVRLAQVFKVIMRKKGTVKAIEECLLLLLRSQDIEEDFYIEVHTLTKQLRSRDVDLSEMYTIDIYLPSNVKDIVLVKDLFEYILPTGFLYNIYNSDLEKLKKEVVVKNTNVKTRSQQDENSSVLFGQVFTSDNTTTNLETSGQDLEKGRTYTSVVVNAPILPTPSQEENNQEEES